MVYAGKTRVFTPIAEAGVTKYGEKGLFEEGNFAHLSILPSWRAALAATANAGLAKSTWSSYKTGIKMFQLCCRETNAQVSFPLDHDSIVTFVAWMLNRGLAASTMQTYITSLRQFHSLNNFMPPTLRSPLVNIVLEGKKHLDAIQARTNPKKRRLPMTPTVMKLLKKNLKDSNHKKEEQLLIWCIATIAFAGALRIHEILARNETKFDPAFTLLGKDLKLLDVDINGENVNILQVRIKSEKKDRIGVDCLIDIYESKGELCPIKAFKKWSKIVTHTNRNLPAFCDSQGKPFTGRRMNETLKDMLQADLKYDLGKYSAHSFRIGMASMMGQLGFSDEDVKACGRWSSRAFETYFRLPRTRRLEMARKLAALKL